MYGNTLPADQILALQTGDVVTVGIVSGSFGRSELHHGEVAKRTPKQIVVHYEGPRGTIEARFARENGRLISSSARGYLLDPTHPLTLASVAESRRRERRQVIDRLAGRWSRERNNLEVLRQLQVAISEYLDAEDGE